MRQQERPKKLVEARSPVSCRLGSFDCPLNPGLLKLFRLRVYPIEHLLAHAVDLGCVMLALPHTYLKKSGETGGPSTTDGKTLPTAHSCPRHETERDTFRSIPHTTKDQNGSSKRCRRGRRERPSLRSNWSTRARGRVGAGRTGSERPHPNQGRALDLTIRQELERGCWRCRRIHRRTTCLATWLVVPAHLLPPPQRPRWTYERTPRAPPTSAFRHSTEDSKSTVTFLADDLICACSSASPSMLRRSPSSVVGLRRARAVGSRVRRDSFDKKSSSSQPPIVVSFITSREPSQRRNAHRHTDARLTGRSEVLRVSSDTVQITCFPRFAEFRRVAPDHLNRRTLCHHGATLYTFHGCSSWHASRF